MAMTRTLHPPLVRHLVPVGDGVVGNVVRVALGVTILAALAQVRLEIGAVPLTGQTLGVLLLAAAYGAGLGAVTLLTYLVAGLGGLPFFAGGASGWSVLQGTTGGYLIGFVVAALLVGHLSERGWDRSYGRTAIAMLLGNLVIYGFGLAWLVQFAPDFGTTLQWGLWPFLAGDLLKLLLAVALLPTAWRLLGRR